MGMITLITPLQIYDTALTFFPSAQIVKVQDSPLHVDLKLSPTIQPIRLTEALDKFAFLAAIQELAIERFKAKKQGVDQVFALNPEHFSTHAPLKNWAEFTRALHIRDGKKCEDVIKTYLAQKAPPIPDALINLGFAPHQVERAVFQGELPNEDIAYFTRVISSLKDDDLRIQNMRERYPHMLRRVATDIVRANQAIPRTNRNEEILGQLQNQVIGQKIACEALAAILARLPRGKNGVFLFVGPTGVGKTQMAMALAPFKNNRYLSIMMNEYTERHTVSLLFGSPPGYIGSQDKPQFAKALAKYGTIIDAENVNVDGVILLLDELEKAHDEVRQALLTLFEKGEVTIRYSEQVDSKVINRNVKYKLTNSIIISTSNLCQETILQGFLRSQTVNEISTAFMAANLQNRHQHQNNFSNELMSRQTIIPFGPIPRGEEYRKLLRSKVMQELPKIKEEFGNREFEVEDEENFYTVLEEKLYGEGTDIRRVINYITSIRDPIIQKQHLWGNIADVKIVLYAAPLEQQIRMKITTFNPHYNGYIETPEMGFYLIG